MPRFTIAIPAVVAGLALAVFQVEASPSSIGVFFDTDATDCDISLPPGSGFNVYVMAVLGTDAAASGITGAEFRVVGLTGIVSSLTPNPECIAVGDPTIGCNIGFLTCMRGEGPRNVILLYTISCSVDQLASPRTVTVTYHWAAPFDAPPWAPSVDLCDHPHYTELLVSGGQALINNGSCTVDVQPTTWASVKRLFTANTVMQPPAPREKHK